MLQSCIQLSRSVFCHLRIYNRCKLYMCLCLAGAIKKLSRFLLQQCQVIAGVIVFICIIITMLFDQEHLRIYNRCKLYMCLCLAGVIQQLSQFQIIMAKCCLSS